MAWLIFKYLTTATVVVLISELAKRNEKWGAIVLALPLISVLTLIWLHVENQEIGKIANYAKYTFWYVIPTLPMFLVLQALLPKLGFWFSLLISLIVACIFLIALASLLRQFGIELL
jgi:hypothetical protein